MTSQISEHQTSSHKGSLKQSYENLKEIIPRHPACKGLKCLGAEIGKELGKPPISEQNIRRDLGFTETHPIARGYLGAFKRVFGLDTLGIDDSILFKANKTDQKSALNAAFQAKAFNWLYSLGKDDKSLTLSIDPSAPLPAGIYLRRDLGWTTQDGEQRDRNAMESAMGVGSEAAVKLKRDKMIYAQVGYTYRFHIALDEPGFVTVLNQDPETAFYQGQEYQPTSCIDGLLGCIHQDYPKGETPLPNRFKMNPPEGLTRTLMIVTPRPLDVLPNPEHLRELTPAELNAFLSTVMTDTNNPARIYTEEYIVTHNTFT